MNDEALSEAWGGLAPTSEERRRIDTQVFSWLDAHDTSLAGEWLGLFKVEPLAAVSLAAVSAIALIAASPLFWLARALMH
jgi:hypothetical protein